MSQSSQHSTQKTGSREAQEKLEAEIDRAFADRLVKQKPHAWEFGLAYGLEPNGALGVFRELRDERSLAFDFLVDITAVDWMDKRDKRFEVVYQLLSLSHLHRLCLRIPVGEENPEVDSVRSLWAAANFLEREVWDMYGIKFRGHGDLRRILMYEEFVGFPLRKDYPLRGKQPRVPLRIPELRNTSADMKREQLVSLPVRGSRGSATE